MEKEQKPDAEKNHATARRFKNNHNGNSDHLRPDDFEQIAIVQNATEGKAVVVDGGTCTAEAWQIERKMRILEQLKLARKLRATMEKAYEDAKKTESKDAALKAFESHKNTMMEMISLTDAVKGNYVLDDYKEYTNVETDRIQRERHSHLSAQSIFGDIRKRIAWENSPDLFIQEHREAQLGRQAALESTAQKRKQSSIAARAKDLPTSAGFKLKTSAKQSAPREKKLPTSASFKKKKIANQSSPSMAKEGKAKSPSPVGEEKSYEKKDQQTVANNSNSNLKRSPPKVAKKPKAAGRKCHFCKELKTDYLACTYWFITGKRCKKTFCQDCIQSQPHFKHVASVDFQCPACLGICGCDACLKSRNIERQSTRVKRRVRDYDVM